MCGDRSAAVAAGLMIFSAITPLASAAQSAAPAAASPSPEAFMAGDSLSVKRRYLHALIGTSCGVVGDRPVFASAGAFGRGAAARLSPSALVTVMAGALGPTGVPWVKARAKSGLVWVRLGDLTCV
jgi:hypothetical protein